MSCHPTELPLANENQLESIPVLKKLAATHRRLAELKGVAGSIPNENILISTLTLQEAKDSSEVENIVTTHDELFRSNASSNPYNAAVKEVSCYAKALNYAFDRVRKSELLRLQDILDIQQSMESNNAGLRKLPGTELKNAVTGEVVYTPPQNAEAVSTLMSNLVAYINDDALSDNDPLIKMAVIHFQFESIHPFYDGNGRTGRIINILYLVLQGLLDLPILYLSRYIIKHKSDYYNCLQAVRDKSEWESWLLFMLTAIEETALETALLVKRISGLMLDMKHRLRSELPKIYSQDLLNNIFCHPYTKIDYLENDLSVSRVTATRYLNLLCEKGFLQKNKEGKSNYYINTELVQLLADAGE